MFYIVKIKNLQAAMTIIRAGSPGILIPTCSTTGNIIRAPTVCEIKDVITRTIPEKRTRQWNVERVERYGAI